MSPSNPSKPSPRTPADDRPLELADSRAGSSTHPVASHLDAQPEPSSADSQVRSGSAAGDTRGKSTGFDTMLGRIVIERGFVTREELDLCESIRQEATQDESPRTLSDLLIDNAFVTRRQIDRLRNDFEAEKTTQRIPGYRILRRLGSGAMATVFLARQMSLDRLVAIKVLPTKFSANEKFIERFYKEGRAAAQLNHRNIVGAYDVGQAGEHHYFVMEYVDGETVYDRIVNKKRFDEKESIDVVRQVAEALKHAHERGFIHRDIKPKNIMISKDGIVKLADLGLARAVSDKEAAESEAGRAYGTPYYISPEQIRGEVTIGPQADIYGLGATFYHMVTGRVPFEGRNPSSVMHKHLKTPLLPPDHVNPKLSAGVAQIIEMMMAKSRKDRYRNVTDLIEDLDLVRRNQAPHFAHSHVNLSSVATAIQKEARAKAAPPSPPAIAAAPGPTSSPAFMLVIVVMILSLLANLVLALMLAS